MFPDPLIKTGLLNACWIVSSNIFALEKLIPIDFYFFFLNFIHVLKFNAVTSPRIYSEIAYCVFPNLKGNSSQDIAQEFVEKLSELSKRCGLQQKLSEVGIKSNSLNMLAREAMNQTRLLVNNPRDLNEKDAFHIYKAAL